MKVCFLAGTLGRGGAEKQLVFMLRALKRAGVETRVLCLTKGEDYEAQIKSLGVEVEYVGAARNQWLRLLNIIRSLRRRRADVLQSAHFYTNIYAALAGKMLGIPSIGAIRNNLLSELEAHGTLGKFQLSLPQFLIANSGIGRQNALARGITPQKIEFVRNAVEIAPDEAEKQTAQTIKFLMVGRLVEQKRADRFVRLASALVEKFPNLPLQFQIAGDGVMRGEIEQQARECNLLPDKLQFLGECRSMSEVYKQADALVLTSDYEGTPNVILEAMAHRLPVIAAKVGGVPEILNEDCGILVEPDDENGLFEAAAGLINKPELRNQLGDAGFEYVKNNHSLDSLQKHLINIYAGLLDKGKKEIETEEVLAEKVLSR